MSPPRVSVIVCSLNGEKVLPTCLRSLAESTGVDFETIVVDNGSTDATPELVRRDFPHVRLLQTGRNLGFAGGNNVGIQAARGELFVLLNDDTETPSDCLARLAAAFDRDPAIGAVGCKLLYPDRATIQHAGGVLNPNATTLHKGYGEDDNGQWDAGREVNYLTGAALALRRTALKQVGLLDPGFFPIYFEEVDLQTRMRRAGWKLWYEGAAWLIHFESQTQGVASKRFYLRYNKNRIRYLALNGFGEFSKWTALRWELAWWGDVIRRHRVLAVLQAYAVGTWNWPRWRSDRETRRSVPGLGDASMDGDA